MNACEDYCSFARKVGACTSASFRRILILAGARAISFGFSKQRRLSCLLADSIHFRFTLDWRNNFKSKPFAYINNEKLFQMHIVLEARLMPEIL